MSRGKFASRGRYFLAWDSSGPGTYSLPGNYCRDSESVSKKVLGSGRTMPLQLLQNHLCAWILGSNCTEQLNFCSAGLSSMDLLPTCLGICCFCLQWESVLNNLCSYFNPNYVFGYLLITWEFTNTLTYWLTSLLAVFHWVRVSSFTCPILLWPR